MVEMAASIREQSRQTKVAKARHEQHGGLFIDALTGATGRRAGGLDAAADHRPVRRSRAEGGEGPQARSRAHPARAVPELQDVDGRKEAWTFGYLIDVILTRDPWMHRVDIAVATGANLVLTADHDGVLVADIVAEWAAGTAGPYSLRLTGPAGGEWSAGADGPHIELDAVQFCRAISGRAPAEGLLTTQVPF